MNFKHVITLAIIALAAHGETFEERYGLGKPKQKAPPRSAAGAAAIPQPTYFQSNGITFQVYAPCFRIVTNHLFNIDQSPLWIVQKLEVLHAVENGLLCEEVKYQRTYAPNPVPESQSIGAYGSAPGRHLESETRIPGKEILLRNCTDPARPEIIVKAMNVGLATVLGKRREVWDCGRLCIAPLAARTNAPANPPAQVATP